MLSRVLVADDDAGTRAALERALAAHGYDVRVADGREQLMAQLAAERPDLLLLDVVMPGSDGISVLQELKAHEAWRELPVLMMSSRASEEVTERCFGLGAADFLRKPVRPRELLARVQHQLRLHGSLRAVQRSLKLAEQELSRAREEVENRRKLVDILHEVTGDLSSDEIYHILARRVARALDLSRCSVILAAPGDKTGVVATAFDNPSLRDMEIDLERYPEIAVALERGAPVLVEDLRTSPLYAEIRAQWEAQGISPPVRSVIALPFTLGEVQHGVFFLRRMLDEPPLTEEDVAFADTVVKAAVAAIHRARMIEDQRADNARLEQLALTDPLTQVLNRRALLTRLGAEVDRARRYDGVITMLMVDLDHFKKVNDTLGHLTGDDVLREFAALLAAEVRSVDYVARYGGEEFVIVLPETPRDGGVRFANRIREKVAAGRFAAAGGGSGSGGLALTTSIGVATYPGPEVNTVEDLFARADEALYRAKADGRNRVRT